MCVAAAPTLYWHAPEIVHTRSSFTAGQIALNVTFAPPASYPGRMYCAAFPASGNTTITNVGQVVTAGTFVPYFEDDERANIVISGLHALSPYVTYCYFETSQGVSNSLSTVRATREFHTTSCCKTVTFLNAPSVLYGDPSRYTTAQANRYVFRYALSAAPLGVLTVTPSLVSAAGLPVAAGLINISPGPKSFSAASTLLESSFILAVDPVQFFNR